MRMKIPLQYQRTEYDCGPTSFLNALSFLINREDFPPDILRHCMLCTLDSYNEKGEPYKNGTSKMAMFFLASWLNEYAKVSKLPIYAETLMGKEVSTSEGSKILEALRQGGVVVSRVYLDGGHYVTLTGVSKKGITLFDPYYQSEPFSHSGISMIIGSPFSANRLVSREIFDLEEQVAYSFGPIETREAVILYNTTTYKVPQNSIEYYL